jgi:hypothetical protein
MDRFSLTIASKTKILQCKALPLLFIVPQKRNKRQNKNKKIDQKVKVKNQFNQQWLRKSDINLYCNMIHLNYCMGLRLY